jgi:hypothetical protein
LIILGSPVQPLQALSRALPGNAEFSYMLLLWHNGTKSLAGQALCHHGIRPLIANAQV